MPDNTLLEEVRAARHRIASECDNDPVKIASRAADAAKRFIQQYSTPLPKIVSRV